ncbi:serine/threonine-protein kinase [Kribbella sp. NPDC049174]|uniref:serine/threonine-protein kinase n=1 Tax=Kribbella sp. NPDC049174 TaxID=3364112 RepID=UPI003722D12B
MRTGAVKSPPTVVGSERLVTGRYRLRALLGRGGMGCVWLAEDELLRRRVALKQVVLPGCASEHVRATALAEARAAARLDHRNVVKVLDVVEDSGDHWIVMEPLYGRTLADTLVSNGPLPTTEVRRIALHLVDALRAIHRAGLVHSDVKPSNVQLCDDGRVVLMDFGIAAAVDGHQTPSSESMAGSPAYMSPERARGDVVGPASDLFSLGATLFAAVEGRSPFGAGDLFSTMAAVVEARPRPFVNAGPLRPIIEAMLAKAPSDRPTVDQTAAALHPGARHSAARRATPVVASLRRFAMMVRYR